MAIKEFTEKQRRQDKEPEVRISKKGAFNINRSCNERFLKDARFVVFLFDDDTDTIYLRPASEDVSHAYKLRELNGQMQVSGTAFLTHFGIQFGDAVRRFSPEWDHKLKALALHEKKEQ